MSIPLFDRLRARLCDDWHNAWRWWSVQYNAVLAVLVALFVDHSSVALGLAGIATSGWMRVALVIAVALMWFLPAVGFRLVDQDKIAAEKETPHG